MDRVQIEVGILAENVDDGSARLFQRYGDEASAESLRHCDGPEFHRFRGVFQLATLDERTSLFLQRPGMFLVSPIQADEGGEYGSRRRRGAVG